MAASHADEIKVVLKTPIELTGFGMTFEKLEFTFSTPVTARFWIDYDMGRGAPHRMEVPHDHLLPASHYALSYFQPSNDQVSVSVTAEGNPPDRRTGGTGGAVGAGNRVVTYKPPSPLVGLNQDIELYEARINPPWRRPKDPVKVYKIMCHFSSATFTEDPIPMKNDAGWQKIADGRMAIIHRRENSFDWTDVSPRILAAVDKARPGAAMRNGLMDLSALDANEAWLAVVMATPDHHPVMIEHTTDGGKHWRESAAQVEADAVKISYVTPRCGFLLALGSPSAGLMDKAVYGTTDAGAHWVKLAEPPKDGQNYDPTGMIFRSPQEGWITATCHGTPDAPLFHTRDGGRSWQLQKLEFPPDYVGGYADIYPPFLFPLPANPDFLKGKLPVRLVRHVPGHDREMWIYYLTDDGGNSWHLPELNKAGDPASGN